MSFRLTHDQRRKISVSLVSSIIVEFKEDRAAPTHREGWEQGLVRLFACCYACNHAPMLKDVNESNALCDSLFEVYYSLLAENGLTDSKFQELEQNIQERFAAYYRATEFLGKSSDHNVPFHLSGIRGSAPVEAFVLFEKYFQSFVAPGTELSHNELRALVQEPMKGRFGLFLKLWNEANERINEVLS